MTNHTKYEKSEFSLSKVTKLLSYRKDAYWIAVAMWDLWMWYQYSAEYLGDGAELLDNIKLVS